VTTHDESSANDRSELDDLLSRSSLANPGPQDVLTQDEQVLAFVPDERRTADLVRRVLEIMELDQPALPAVPVRRSTPAPRAASTGRFPPRVQRVASLSEAERTIAGLVAAGLTNPQICGRLGLSPHMVNYHLRHIYQILGIQDRAQVAAALRRDPQSAESATQATREGLVRRPAGLAAPDLGRGPITSTPSATPDRWDRLSTAERRIARLVNAGLTNKEIGRSLFLAPATVTWYLKTAFRKLQISSRVQLAVVAAAHPNEPTPSPNDDHAAGSISMSQQTSSSGLTDDLDPGKGAPTTS
jgi:DNA-binding CsgD family transcriptional regulator